MNPETTSTSTKPKSFTRFFPHIARVLMGLLFTFSGLNGFFHFADPKEEMPKAVMDLMAGFQASGYMFPLIFGTQLVCGLLLLVNRFVPLALAMIMPVIVNIVALHVFIAPKGIPMAIFVLALQLYLAFSYRKVYCPMLAAKVTPGGQG
jgi:uncharacterized membrane protein YphA (DoxX/SURF4 family)